jgi:hypothetical protein
VTETVYCGSCGGEIAADAGFCKHCGANQAEFQEAEEIATQQAPPPVPPASASPSGQTVSVGGRAEQVAPGSTELAGQLATHLRTPGVALAGLSALVGAAICLAFGLIVAVALPHASFISVGGSGLFKETLIQAVAFSQANLDLVDRGESIRTVPVLFVLIPILGVAAGTAGLAPRTAGMPPRERMLWATGAGIPFALIMLIVSLSVGQTQFDLFSAEVEVSGGSVFMLSLVWGALGGALGMAFALRNEAEPAQAWLPPSAIRYAGITWTALRPLLLALLVVGMLGTVAWVVQIVSDDDYRAFPPRSTAVAIGEQVAYAGDRAIDILPLGAGASERLGNYPVVPVDLASVGDLIDQEFTEGTVPTYNLFDFGAAMPAYLFVPMLIALIAIPALLALYAGFAVARRQGETRLERAAAWGAIVGPLWAISMVLLAALARKTIIGDPSGDSVFVAFLLGGTALGALGGALAAQGAAPATAPPPQPQPPPAAPPP